MQKSKIADHTVKLVVLLAHESQIQTICKTYKLKLLKYSLTKNCNFIFKILKSIKSDYSDRAILMFD